MTNRSRNSTVKHKFNTKMGGRKGKPAAPGRTRKSKLRPKLIKTSRKGAVNKKALPNPKDPREKALSLMKQGVSQTAAAKSVGISTQRLARYRRATTTSKIKGGKWVIKDHRPAEMYIASKGKFFAAAVPYRGKSAVGHYWNAVNEFLADNDASHLRPFANRSIRDINGKLHTWETGPNTLRMMDAIGELSFVEIYSNVAK